MKLLEVFEEIGEITPGNVDGKYRVGKVIINNEDGLGATPNNGNVLYMGFVAFINPSTFLKLAARSGDRHERAEKIEIAAEGKGIGSPCLYVYAKETDPWGGMKITGHEGRARISIIEKYNGDAFFPVQFFVRPEIRARHLDAKFFEVIQTELISETGTPMNVKFDRIFWNGKELK